MIESTITKPKQEEQINKLQRLYRDGMAIEIHSLREAKRLERLLKANDITFGGNDGEILKWLSNFSDKACVYFTRPGRPNSFTAARVEVFHIMDGSGQEFVTYRELKKLFKEEMLHN